MSFNLLTAQKDPNAQMSSFPPFFQHQGGGGSLSMPAMGQPHLTPVGLCIMGCLRQMKLI